MPTLEQARDWYDEKDVVHGYTHIQRVYQLAERLAIIERADVDIVRAAALLHDVQGSGTDQSMRDMHHIFAASFAAQWLTDEGWIEARIAQVQHCIRSHRYRDESEQPITLEAKILFDADKLDSIGAIGVVRALLYAVEHGKPVYSQPSARFIENGDMDIEEEHSAYHEYIYKLRNIKDRLFTNTARQLAEARHDDMCRFFDGLAAEWNGLR